MPNRPSNFESIITPSDLDVETELTWEVENSTHFE
jgi:hypothetical protein